MYYRYRIGSTPVMSDWGHALFAAERSAVEGTYGDTLYTYDGASAVDIATLESAIVEAWDSCMESGRWGQWSPDEYMRDLSGLDVAALFAPADIVSAAEGWDDPIVQWLWEHVLEPRGIFAVATPDGAVVFDERLIVRA